MVQYQYDKAFEEVEDLMSEMLEQLKIGIDEIGLYPADDVFRIIIKVMSVENIKILSYILNHCDILEIEKYFTPVLNTFMWWWADCFEHGSFSISELIASKENELILLLMSEEGAGKKLRRI